MPSRQDIRYYPSVRMAIPGPGPQGLELGIDIIVKGLILAQNERWRRGLGMQVERAW